MYGDMYIYIHSYFNSFFFTTTCVEVLRPKPGRPTPVDEKRRAFTRFHMDLPIRNHLLIWFMKFIHFLISIWKKQYTTYIYIYICIYIYTCEIIFCYIILNMTAAPSEAHHQITTKPARRIRESVCRGGPRDTFCFSKYTI